MAVETQNYLDEAKTPSVITPNLVRAGTKTWVPRGGKASQQANLWARLLQESEIEEPDDELRGLFEEAFQIFGAIRRLTGEIELGQRQLIGTYRQFTDLDARMRTRAVAVGYTI